jgi:hypothetical protein
VKLSVTRTRLIVWVGKTFINHDNHVFGWHNFFVRNQ